MSVKPIGVGVIGCGMISATYFPNMVERFDILNVIGCADLVREKAELRAKDYGCTVMTNEEIYNHPDIQLVVNLTNVWSHYEVTKAALEHGKHVYSEKMLAETYEDAKELYDLAASKGLILACAPDTFLGGGYQTVKKYLDDGLIGEPFAIDAVIVRGYKQGGAAPRKGNVTSEGGTIPFDMGGYYMHAMINLFGPVKRVSGFSKRIPKKYTHPSHPQYKETFLLEKSPNFIHASLEFENGVIGSLIAGDNGIMTPDIPGMMIYGSEGNMFCPDPNMFGGPVKIIRNGMKEWVQMPLLYGYSGEEPAMRFGPQKESSDPMTAMWSASRRGIGPADIAWAITNNRPARISNELGLHAIEIIHGVDTACKTGQYYTMTSHPVRPATFPMNRAGESVFDDTFED